jgi:hypothetical protein
MYHEVLAEKRQSLEESVNRLVELEMAGDWKDVYPLLDLSGVALDLFPNGKADKVRKCYTSSTDLPDLD